MAIQYHIIGLWTQAHSMHACNIDLVLEVTLHLALNIFHKMMASIGFKKKIQFFHIKNLTKFNR